MNNLNSSCVESAGTAIQGKHIQTMKSFFKNIFLRWGVLPFLLAAALVIFSLASDQFLSWQNMINLLRQSTYLILVALGQMLVLVSAGFDLSVGTTLAVTSVVSALVMGKLASIWPDAVWGAVAIGCLAGVAAGAAIGLVNGIGVAYFGVSPFIMTMGIQSVAFGVALFLTGGVPVDGLPPEFGELFGFGSVFGVPIPVITALVAIVVLYVLMDRTSLGSYLYAVGGNRKAAALSGISTSHVLLFAYVLCSVLAGVSGLLLTGRTGSGEANIGGSMALESIAACVIAGVSLRGGVGRVESVVLGAIFIGLVQNGMNLAGIGSYLQMIALGSLLIIAVIFDQVRSRHHSLGE